MKVNAGGCTHQLKLDVDSIFNIFISASEVGTQPVAQDSPDQLRNADDPGVYELPGYISNEEEDEEDDEDAQREAILPAVLAGAIMDAAEEPVP